MVCSIDSAVYVSHLDGIGTFPAPNKENKNEMVDKWDRIGGGITLRTDILVGNRHKVSKCVP